MNHKEWLLADKNIQYRTINAMIKEHIVSEGMRIKEGTCKVEIFLNNHLLSLKVARKSALKRYVFTGDIVLKNKKLSHIMKYITQTFWHEANICCFTPYEKIQTHVEYLPLLNFQLTLREPRQIMILVI